MPTPRSTQSRTDEYVQQICRDGYCVVEGVIGQNDVVRVRKDAVRTTHTDQDGGYRPVLSGIAVAQDLINISQVFAPFLVSPPLIAVIEALLGEHAHVNSASALVTYPGNELGDWHTDWPYNPGTPDHLPTPYLDMTIHLSLCGC